MPDIFTDLKTLANKYIARLDPPGDFWSHLHLCEKPVGEFLCSNYSASSTENHWSGSGRQSSPDTLTRYHFCAPCARGKRRHRDRGIAGHVCRNALTDREQALYKGLFPFTPFQNLPRGTILPLIFIIFKTLDFSERYFRVRDKLCWLIRLFVPRTVS